VQDEKRHGYFSRTTDFNKSDRARRMSVFMAAPALSVLSAKALHQGRYVLGPPSGSASAKFYRLGKAACAASFPPCGFPDGEDGKDLGQTEKAGRGNERFLL